MTRAFVFITVGFVAMVLVACASTAPTPAPASQPPSAIEYTRTGGLIGLNDRLTIDTKGHAVLSRRNVKSEFDVSDANLKQLYDAFQAARFAAIPENSMPIGVIADAFNYTLTYQGHTVKTADTAVPKSLEALLALLNRIVETQGK